MKKNTHIKITIFITLICLLVSPLIYKQPFIKRNIFVKEYNRELKNQIAKDNALLNVEQGTTRIATLNLLAHYPSWGGNSVAERKELFYTFLDGYSPDVLGVQEMCNDWYGEIKRYSLSYKFTSPFTTAFPHKMTAILYNCEKLELIDSGNTAFSNAVNFKSRRITWAVFRKIGSTEVFTVINTHLSYIPDASEEAFFIQTYQINELHRKVNAIYEKYKYPIFIIGDFNTKRHATLETPTVFTGTYGIINSIYTDAEKIAQNKFHGENLKFTNTLNDHIFINGNVTVKNISLLSQNSFSHLSDHYPLMVDVIF